jgi:hypothetical protein
VSWSLALAEVVTLAEALERNDRDAAKRSRDLLDELTEGWNSGKSYPMVVRQALREHNLSESPRRRGPGRPSLDGARTVMASTRLSETEHAGAVAAAERAGKSLSEWMRGVIVQASR